MRSFRKSKRFFLHGLVGNLILEKNREKKFWNFRGSQDISFLPGVLIFGKKIFFLFFLQKKFYFRIFLQKTCFESFFDTLFFVIKKLSHPKKIWFVIPIIAHNMNNTNV